MKKFVKMIALVLCFAMIAAFAACGGNKDNDSDKATNAANPDASTAPVSADGAYKIGFIGPLTGDTAIYGVAAKNGAQIAVDEVCRFIEKNPGKLDLVEWILFDERTKSYYDRELARL